MNFNEYAKKAIRTLVNKGQRLNVLHGITGVVTEVGELADAYKRHIWYGTKLDRVNLTEEVGDVLWYIAILATEFNMRDLDFIIPDELKKAEGTPEDTAEDSLLAILETGFDVSQLVASYSYYYKLDSASETEFREASKEEIGAILTWMKCVCVSMGVDIVEAAKVNIAKLQKRFPDKFSEEAAVNRDLASEREVLEAGVV